MSGSELMVEAHNLCLGYGDTKVLPEVNLAVERGSFLPLVGPNGAGKTTLLRGLLGLLKPQAGRVIWHLNGDPPGYVPQGWKLDAIYPLTTLEVVLQGRYPHLGWLKRPSRRDRELALEALEEVHLSDAAEANYRDLSGGMKQKALIARAMAAQPEVLLLDEPTSEVDKPSELDVLHHLQQLNRTKGITVLLVCHAIGSIFNYADRCLLVEHGRIYELSGDAIEEVKARYV